MIDKQIVEAMIPGIEVVKITDNMLMCVYGLNYYKANLSQNLTENLKQIELLKNRIIEDALNFYRNIGKEKE